MDAAGFRAERTIMEDRGRFPDRKIPRLKGYDYSTPNYYFVTICCHRGRELFGPVGETTAFRKIALRGLRDLHLHFPNAKVDKCVVMPNHVHCILILEGQGPDLSTIVGQYKSAVSREIRKHAGDITVWQRSFYDEVIRSEESYQNLWGYIHTNPQNWHSDEFFCPALEP